MENNNSIKIFISLLEEAKKCVKGELELDCFDGEWYAMDYREDLGAAFPIEINGFDKPLITEDEAKNRCINIIKCCDELEIAYVG